MEGSFLPKILITRGDLMDLFLLSFLIGVIGKALYHVIRIHFLLKKERNNNIKVKG